MSAPSNCSAAKCAHYAHHAHHPQASQWPPMIVKGKLKKKKKTFYNYSTYAIDGKSNALKLRPVDAALNCERDKLWHRLLTIVEPSPSPLTLLPTELHPRGGSTSTRITDAGTDYAGGAGGEKKMAMAHHRSHASAPFHPVSFRFLYTSSLVPILFFGIFFITFLSLQSRSFSSLANICLRPVFQTTHILFRAASHTIILP